jgi:dipeptidyl aminopeptidase/acylaminoacyl peptidase
MSKSERRGMRPEDVGGLRQATSPRVSPDGSTVAFVVTNIDLESNRYRNRVWMAGTDGNDLARPFTAGPDDHLPQWSPDGRWIAFAVAPKDELAQICLLPVAHGGERVVVAEWPAPTTELLWSPDGSHLAFVARDPDPDIYGAPGEERKPKDTPPRRVTHFFSRLDSEGWLSDRPSRVFVVAADGMSTPLALTSGPFDASGISWSPDGSRIAFSSARHATWDLDGKVDLWTVSADGSDQPERVTETDAAYYGPTWSPDGSRLSYFVSPTPYDEPRHIQLGVLDLATRRKLELTTDLDRNCFPYGGGRSAVWAGDRLLFSVEDSGNVHVYSVAADGGGKPEPVVDGELWVNSWDWAGETLATVVTTPTTFPELTVTELSNGRVVGGGGGSSQRHALTQLTRDFASVVELADPVAFVARSADGTEVPCWAMAPVGAESGKRYPTILNVHGGPFTSYGNRFFDEFQVQVGAGFGILYCNPRGSSGYTEAWGRAVRWPEAEPDPGSGWGGLDFEDVMACVEEGCKRFDWVDSDLLGIQGGSYGGYMTSWAIGHTDRFVAAISERACNNLLTLEINSDAATGFRGFVGRSHLDDPEAYLRQSPITYVKEISTPVLILHSENDLRCPIGQAEELFVALRLLGHEPELVRFPGESHELSRSGAPRHRVARMELILDWFTKRLGDPSQ